MKNQRDVQLVDDLRTPFTPRGWRDILRALAPAIVVLALANSARAQAPSGDLSLGALVRSYPLSGVLELGSGYNLPVWGTPRTPLSGYVRPRLYASSAAVYNSGDLALEIFPLGFLGARAGSELIQNDADYSAYDCRTYRCQGRFNRAYFETELSLGLGPVFAQARWRRERWGGGQGVPQLFIDPTSGVALNADGESQTVYYGVLGVNLNPRWALIGLLRYAVTDARELSRTPTLMVRYRQGRWTMGVGAGVFESTLKKRDFTATAFLRWEIWPSLALR